MRNRHKQQPQRSSTPTGRRARLLLRWLPVVLLAVLAFVAVLAPAGQAHTGSSEAQAQASQQKAAEREERAAAREQQAAARKAEREAEREAKKVAAGPKAPSPGGGKSLSLERNNGADSVEISCTAVTWHFSQFPANQSNTVSEKVSFVKVKGQAETTVASKASFTFQGASGSNVTAIDAPPGTYIIDAEAHWAKTPETVGKNGFDIHSKETCEPTVGYTVEKLQKLETSSAGYATATAKAEVGQTIDYEILVSNTGNEPLTLDSFSDPHCDAGTLSGGPAAGRLEPNTTSTYLCKHVLTEGDLSAGTYENTAQVTVTDPEETTTSKTTDTVIAEVVAVGTLNPPSTPGATPTSGVSAAGPSASAPTGSGGTSGTGKSGVLGFSATSVPALKGPEGCVRGSFHASIKSAGVASVTFYLDGHKLRTLSARNARKGLLSILVNPSKLAVGAHRLVAKITMATTAAATKPTKASRSLTVLRCHSDVVTPKFTG